MYDAFSSDYDRFVDWPSRLSTEMPFLEKLLQTGLGSWSGSLHILDAACGTGMHAIALAQKGYIVGGADLSQGMIARAQVNASLAGVSVKFEAAGFGELKCTFRSCNVLLCLGNSLPHVLTLEDLGTALADFYACLQPGGLVIIQNRNFDAVLAYHERWMEPQYHREGETEWLFQRFYDFEQDGLITFNIVTLKREGNSSWSQQVSSTRLRPLLQAELIRAMSAIGFQEILCYGAMSGDPFDPNTSGNLILVARK